MSLAPLATKSSPAGRLAGAVVLSALYVGILALIVSMRGMRPETFRALEIGTVLGLIALVIELGMAARSARTFHAQGVQTTFMSFLMRMATVAPLTLLFMKPELGIDCQAFALSYCGTFFLYLCWLSWTTYHQPSQYSMRRTAIAAAAAHGAAIQADGRIVVRDNRRPGRREEPASVSSIWNAAATMTQVSARDRRDW